MYNHENAETCFHQEGGQTHLLGTLVYGKGHPSTQSLVVLDNYPLRIGILIIVVEFIGSLYMSP